MAVLDGTQAHESKLYAELSHFYEAFFANVFGPRIRRVIHSLALPEGAEVLEVGIGTGLSIDAYPHDIDVTGIDLAPEMLEKAQAKLNEKNLKHIRLQQMNAQEMTFDDDSFDYTMAFHVVSVVPDHRKLMAEMVRVTRPGGRIVIINHFRSDNRLLSLLDVMSEPVTRQIGWHTLALDEVLADLPLRIDQHYKTSAQSLFTILVAENEK